MKKRLTVLAIFVFIFAIATSPVHAGGIFKFHGDGAFAEWFLDDELNTFVFVSAFDGRIQSPPGRPARQQQLVVSVFQSFCDEDTNEWVFRDLFAFTDDADIHIDRTLNTATASATLEFFGFEERFDGCFNGFFPYEENGYNGNGFEELGPFEANVEFEWDGIGQLVRTRSSFHLDAGPDFKLRFRSNTSFRDAEATGTIAGLEEFVPSQLGTADFANIFSTRDMEMVIGNEFFF